MASKGYGAIMGALALIGLTLPGVVATPAQAERRDGGDTWEKLECVEVGRREDIDIVKVGRREGRFKALRLQLDRGEVRIKDLKVIYADGEPDHLAVNATLDDRGPSRPLDLKGWARAIDRIEIVARKSEGRVRGPVDVCIYGLQATRAEIDRSRGGERRGDRDGDRGRDRDSDRGWKELGCERVGFINDRDVMRVGRDAGRFRALRLVASGNKVNMKDMHVFYANGDNEHLRVNSDIQDGEKTPPLDLAGDRRAIDRIEFVYSSKPSLKGEARLCVQGIE